MPELPEVETMVRGLRPELEGRTILELEFCPCTRRPIQVTPSSRSFRQKVRNKTILQVVRFAKRVLIELDSGDTIVVEPRMTGLMLVADPPSKEHRRLCWHLQPKRGRRNSFEFWDRRGLGTVSLLDADGMAAVKARLGPDALQMTPHLWKTQLKRTKRAVKVALLDQKLVAGIGYLYASEILHRSQISPNRGAHRLSNAQIERLHEATQFVLEQAIQYEGSTLGDGTYRNALNKDGSYQNAHVVYQKEGEACTRCPDAAIKRIVQAQRSTFFCPSCQK